MICASCGEKTTASPCAACGRDPLLEGRYRLEAVLGQGAVGTTYRAARLSDGHVVAVKEMQLRRAETEKARELMVREIGLLRQLSHPGIPDHVEDFIAGAGKHRALYLVQDFIEGQPLSSLLAEHRFDEDQTIQIVDGLLGILGYLHQLRPPVIHRDLKPANVMLRPDGSLALIDFGAARDAVKDPDLGGSTVAGTFGYMAPEQFQGDATPATDLYALGVVAAALLTRREPRAMLDAATLDAWLEAAHVSAPLRRYLRSLTAEDPGDRPRSAQEARRLLKRLSAPPSRPAPTPAPVPAPARPPVTASAYAPAPAPESSGGTIKGPLLLVGVLVAGFASLVVFTASDSPPAPPAATAEALHPPEPMCPGGPCVPVGEGQLKGVQLGMNRAEATAALPELVAASALPAERVHAPFNALNADTLLSALEYGVDVPGPRLELHTTLLEQPADCTFHFAVEDRASKMHCALGAASSESLHDQLTNTMRDRLAARYGAPDSSDTPRNELAGIGGTSQQTHRWADETGTLELRSEYTKIMDITATGELEVTFVSAGHAALISELEAQAAEQLRAAQEQRRREEAERIRALQLDGAASDDL